MWFALVSLTGAVATDAVQNTDPALLPRQAISQQSGQREPWAPGPTADSQAQAVAPGLSFPGLLCWDSPPTLQGINKGEAL